MDSRRCCDQAFLTDLLNICTKAKPDSSGLCEWASTLYFISVKAFGKSSFSGVDLKTWLRDAAAPDPDAAKRLETSARRLARSMGEEAGKQEVSIALLA